MKTGSKKPKFLFVTDPWETLDHAKDTTLRLVEAALLEKISCDYCTPDQIYVEGGLAGTVGQVSARVQSLSGQRPAYALGQPKVVSLSEYKTILYRTDPPVDLNYLHPLHLLKMAGGETKGKGPEIVSPVEVLVSSGEKLESLKLTLPKGSEVETFIGSDLQALSEFGVRLGKTVLKPYHSAQSKGVSLLDWTTKVHALEAVTKIEALQRETGSRFVVLQKYLPEIALGEQRLWFLNGALLACARKLPKPGEFKIDMDQGGTLEKTTLSGPEKKVAAVVGAHLKKNKIRMAAVDLIGGRITDFNFTSPGLLVQIESLTGQDLAPKIVKSLLKPF